jgi:hypothetical protein
VHTLSFNEEPKHRPYDDDAAYCDSGWISNPDDYEEDYYASGSDRHPPGAASLPLADAVSAALHARHGASAPAPLRGLRIEFGGGEGVASPSAAAVDGWLH